MVAWRLFRGRPLHIDAMTSVVDWLCLADGALCLSHLDTLLGHWLRLSFLLLRRCRSARCCRHHQVNGMTTVHQICALISRPLVHRRVPKDPLLYLLANLVQEIFTNAWMAQHHCVLLLRLQVGRTLFKSLMLLWGPRYCGRLFVSYRRLLKTIL